MITQTKDYLYLYFGQKFKVDRVAWPEGMEDRFCKVGEIVWIGPMLYLAITENYVRGRIVLRRISDITDEEHLEAKYDHKHPDAWVRDAKRTKYLISIGIDMFGLIDSGLAIDKSKM